MNLKFSFQTTNKSKAPTCVSIQFNLRGKGFLNRFLSSKHAVLLTDNFTVPLLIRSSSFYTTFSNSSSLLSSTAFNDSFRLHLVHMILTRISSKDSTFHRYCDCTTYVPYSLLVQYRP